MADSLRVRTVAEGVFTTDNGNTRFDTGHETLEESGEGIVGDVVYYYIYDNEAYVPFLFNGEGCPF